MDEPFLQLVYFSRATRALADTELDALHQVAQTLNAANGVTGLLLFDGTRFVQALEGEPDQVRATMDRILQDGRHDSIQIAAKHSIAARQFGNWAMDYRRTPPGTCSREFLAQVREDVHDVWDPNLKALFIGFAYLAWH